MSRLLIIAQNASPEEPKAGHKIAFEFARQLAETGSTDVILLINKGEFVDYSAWEKIGCELVYVKEFGPLNKLLAVVTHLFRIPPRYCVRFTKSTCLKIRQLFECNNYNEVWFEFSQSMPYVDTISSYNTKTIASVHDVQTQLVSRGNWFERKIFTHVTWTYEKNLFSKFDTIYTLCEKDSGLVKDKFNYSNVQTRAPVLRENYGLLKRDQKKIEFGSLLFWGAMDRKENSKAIEYFIKNIFPAIVLRIPRVKLYVVGNKPSKSLLRLVADNIIVTGFVEDPCCYFEKTHVGIVPLLSGAGIKIKTIEMLSAGLTVVATDIGAEGIEKNDNLIVEKIESFEKIIVSLLLPRN